MPSSTDGVGTKVAIAQAIDKHDTIGQDLVAMVVDDIIVVGAKPLFMTDYIACGKVVPERIADIVRGIAEACEATGTALVGGETAEHPGLLGPDDYDVAGAATGVVEADNMLHSGLVQDGDVVIAMAASGLHSNGFSLVRHILTDKGIGYEQHSAELGASYGEALLTPTAFYTAPLLRVLEDPATAGAIHSLSHVTGGGIAANLARVLPVGSWIEVDRSTWSPLPVFRHLAELGGHSLESLEGAWNLGVGMFAVVAAGQGASSLRPRSPPRASTRGSLAQSRPQPATSPASSRVRRVLTAGQCVSLVRTRASNSAAGRAVSGLADPPVLRTYGEALSHIFGQSFATSVAQLSAECVAPRDRLCNGRRCESGALRNLKRIGSRHMANINISYQEMEAAASQLGAGRDEITAKLQQLQRQIQGLVSSGFVTDNASKRF